MASPLDTLPDHLAERSRLLGSGGANAGDLVVYWMRYALRGHDNPALDVARALAATADRPLVVVQILRAGDRFASDRLHRFVLEGARDVADELAVAGIAHACHVELAGDDDVALRALAERATLFVSEDLPTPDARAELAVVTGGAPVVLVDTACTLPMRCAGGKPERAFRFRKATAAERAARLALPWPGCDARPQPADLTWLPFTPIDLAGGDFDEVIASAPIDHLVSPVADTPGGSRAGYARWRRFRDERLKRYARDRNDATARDAVSRLSAYLHYGMVSPFVVAREAEQVGGAGADKFLDELLIWREMAYVWCFHTAETETLAALPDWAQASLDAHRDDRRDEVFDWETLARGRTGDALWDAAQTSLLIHGELHNNLRMTWGKMLLGWTATPEATLETLVDLNHRYALDGRDPNSYGGLLWCLGLFDRPFPPGDRVTGTLRRRSTASHANRLDVAGYRRGVERPNLNAAPRVAVVGAGLAGLICARTLADHRVPVVLFDKSRGLGGRLATRRTDREAFDHGAQYFTARDARFRRYVEAWAERGLVARWQPECRETAAGRDPWWVAVPGMSALGRAVGEGVERRQPCRIVELRRADDAWRPIDEEGVEQGLFDAVVVATPAPQAVALLSPVPSLAERAAAAVTAPCWAAMFAFAEPAPLPEAARFDDGPIAWLAHNGAKPGRGGGPTWVVHASPGWSREHLERDPQAVAEELGAALAAIAGGDLPAATYAQAHRWRYARVETPVGMPCLFDADAFVAACGDWCLGGRVEAAFLSGAAVAGRVLNAAVTRERIASVF